jgi:hypothetical protein
MLMNRELLGLYFMLCVGRFEGVYLARIEQLKAALLRELELLKMMEDFEEM